MSAARAENGLAGLGLCCGLRCAFLASVLLGWSVVLCWGALPSLLLRCSRAVAVLCRLEQKLRPPGVKAASVRA